jgi:hypothetical protein
VSGLPTIGSTLRFDLFGEAGASCALLADGQLGSCVRGGLTLGLACTSRLRVVHNSFSGFGGTDEPLGILGRREVSFRIPDDPDLISRTFHVQGVVRDSGTGRAALVTTEVLSLTVLP